MAEISYIRPDSPAEKAGLKSGDDIISINNEKLRDYIDYLFLSLNEELDIEYLDSEDEKIK
ncbi:MAG: PDZ domain-containing protein, partial [Halarsenatibacteraceae bacterium]